MSRVSSAPPARRGSPAKDALSAFEDYSGPRSSIAARIAANKLSPEQEAFVALLLDPVRAGDHLLTLARDAGITPEEILTLFRKGAVAEAHAITIGQLTEGLPGVNQDILKRSVEQERPCKCRRDGRPNQSCKKCGGTGIWVQDADPERQKMVWEATGIIKKGSGLTIQNTQQVGVNVGSAHFMDTFVKNSDSAAYDVGSAHPIDADFTSSSSGDQNGQSDLPSPA